jgi:tetratricopeptide (TPR) repeat protein
VSGHPRARWRTGLLVSVVLLGAVAATWLWRRASPALPSPGSAAYEEVVRAFYSGLAALQVGLLENAGADFGRAGELVPEEPASWANLAIARLRLGDVEAAADPLRRARTLAPNNADLALLEAALETARGQLDRALALLREAVRLEPRHLRARFALAEELERSGTEAGDAEALQLLDELHQLTPANLAVLLERARLAAKRSDAARIRDTLVRLQEPASSWPRPATEQYDALRRAADTGIFADAARATAMLRNVLARVPAYAADLTAVRTPPEIVAEPLEQFLALASPPAIPAPPDPSLTFTRMELDPRPVIAVTAFSLNETDPPVVFTADETTIRRLDTPGVSWPFPGGADSKGALLPLDWNSDFRTDLVAAGSTGVRLLLQRDGGTFEDATSLASGGSPIACGCQGAWAADIEMDGDLDLVLGIAGGPTVVARNNGDGTWTTQETFGAVRDVGEFGWADLDRDGDPDAVFLSSDRVVVFLNDRGGSFSEQAPPVQAGGVSAMGIADVDADGRFDIVASMADGSLQRATREPDGRWIREETARGSAAASGGRVRVLAADFDNNGALDLVRGRTVWLAGTGHRFEGSSTVESTTHAIIDLDGDGQLDLIGIDDSRRPVRLRTGGTRGYHWKQIRVRAQATAGDQRINPFAVGGEIEVRSGLLRQKQLLTGGAAHFGLGTRTSIDVARIVWPNGVPQAEFGAKVDDTIVAEQRLKGSCPWVFAYDGREMRFVTDFLWRSPLGLRINAQETASAQTEDWVRIGGDQLAPRDGFYDVRITAELWETHFFDHLSLMAVDHPAETEIYVDERFSQQPVAFAVQALRDIRPVARARDGRGRDVTGLVAQQDGRFLAAFERGRYQGIAGDHVVEIDLAGRPPAASDRLVLLAQGWVYPTDSSINVAIAQGRHVQPRGLSLEYQDARGRWVVAEPNLGFPAGKNKTMLIDLTRVNDATRLRLRTNLEVSWDLLASAVASREAPPVVRLNAATADLRYRGFSRTISPRGDAPETPIYAPIALGGQRWRDLAGYYTRFGDVRELLTGVDDRYVIMNAGDELVVRFAALPPPEAGWRRDFVLVGDGWEKDGDFNTEFSATVLPLPAHGARPYDPSRVPTHLEDDPVYLRHRGDWERYHTRYVGPDSFAKGLATVGKPERFEPSGR